MKPIKVTPAQIEWLKKHFKHTKNEVIAQRLNISIRSVNRIASKMRLKKTPQFIRKCQLETTRKMNECNRVNGTYPPKGYQIPRAEEFRFKKGEKPIDRIGAKREAERIAKAVKSRKQKFKLEKARALYGLPRETKMPVVVHPKWQISLRHSLRKRGYIIARGSNVVYYNCETKRSQELESRPRTGFTFLEQDGTKI